MSIPANRVDGRKFLFDGAAIELGYLPLGESTEVAASGTKQSVTLKGFSIEVLNFNYAVNVQDTFLNSVSGARVYVTDLADFLDQGFTDRRGCYYGNAEEGITYILTITSDGFLNYVHRFRILPVSALTFPLKNFPVLIHNSSDVPVSLAQVNITSPAHSDSGTTNASGLYEGTIYANQANSIAISKSGFTTYNQVINPYLKISCAMNDVVAVPVIVLT